MIFARKYIFIYIYIYISVGNILKSLKDSMMSEKYIFVINKLSLNVLMYRCHGVLPGVVNDNRSGRTTSRKSPRTADYLTLSSLSCLQIKTKLNLGPVFVLCSSKYFE